ncbi:hypothetical protein FRB91_000434 [Serendipita sp. 411]|nr:hypothetical protein FRB91_000434 [Serendipita sp. 411]KAG8856498.1 hypothetical protein FRC20_000473 [Serendipita sp. 405]
MRLGSTRLFSSSRPFTPRVYADDDLAIANVTLGPTTLNPLYEPLDPCSIPLTWRYAVVSGAALQDSASARLENALWRVWGSQSYPHSLKMNTRNECAPAEYGLLLSPVVISPATIQRVYQRKTVLYHGQTSALAHRHYVVGSSADPRPLDPRLFGNQNVASAPGAPLSNLGAYPLLGSPALTPSSKKDKVNVCVRFDDAVSEVQSTDAYSEVGSDDETEELDDVEWEDMRKPLSVSTYSSPRNRFVSRYPVISSAGTFQGFDSVDDYEDGTEMSGNKHQINPFPCGLDGPKSCATNTHGKRGIQRTLSTSDIGPTEGRRSLSFATTVKKCNIIGETSFIVVNNSPIEGSGNRMKREKSFFVEKMKDEHVPNIGRSTMSDACLTQLPEQQRIGLNPPIEQFHDGWFMMDVDDDVVELSSGGQNLSNLMDKAFRQWA